MTTEDAMCAYLAGTLDFIGFQEAMISSSDEEESVKNILKKRKIIDRVYKKSKKL